MSTGTALDGAAEAGPLLEAVPGAVGRTVRRAFAALPASNAAWLRALGSRDADLERHRRTWVRQQCAGARRALFSPAPAPLT